MGATQLSCTVATLLNFATLSQARELVDRLLDRKLTAESHYHAPLENTTLGKLCHRTLPRSRAVFLPASRGFVTAASLAQAQSESSTVRKREINRASSEAVLQYRLSRETLARRYYNFSFPATIVQVAYLRAQSKDQELSTVAMDELKGLRKAVAEASSQRLDWGQEVQETMQSRGGARDGTSRADDFLHFSKLFSELQEEPASKGSRSDSQVKLGIPLVPLDASGEVTKEEVFVRYQQFSEFSSYTFVLESPRKLGNEDPLGQGATAVSTLLERGERLVQSLRSLGSWWEDIPGEFFLVGVVALAPETFPPESNASWDRKKAPACDALDPPALFRALSHPTASGFPGEYPVGALIGSRSRAAVFSSYELQPNTNRFHAAVLFANDANQAELAEFSRHTTNFLELEQYRLLALSGIEVAQGLVVELERINSEALKVLDALRGAEKQQMSPEERRDELSRLSSLQTRCEALGVEVSERLAASQAYGNLVYDQLKLIEPKQVGGTMLLSRFVRRRLEPALRTYERANARLDETTTSLDRCTALLGTIIDSELQVTNDKLLRLGAVVSSLSLGLGFASFLLNLGVIGKIQ